MPLAVETSGLTKRYPRPRSLTDLVARRPVTETTALDHVTLSIEQGEVFGLLGPNGSGKTTLLKLLSTILAPSSGAARVFGCDVASESRRVRQLVALVTGEERSLYWRLTGRQNLEFFGRLYSLDARTIRRKADELLEMFDLREAATGRVSGYSTGMRQKLAIARGLMSSPRLLFLDEPTRGLDPVAAHALLQIVRERAIERFDNTVILTTHIAREVEQLCHRIAMLDHGTVVYDGTVDDLRGSLADDHVVVLRVAGLSADALAALQRRVGANGSRTLSIAEDVTEIEVSFGTSAATLSDVLRQLLFSGVTILDCTRRERSFEELFRTVFERRRAAGAVPKARSHP